jgi:integrase
MVRQKMSAGEVRTGSAAADETIFGAELKLTLRRIETLACGPGKKDQLFFDDEQRGLAVRVTASGGKSFLAQYTLHRVKKRIPLGSCNAISITAAREAVRAILGDVAQGRDPASERKEAATAAKRAAEEASFTLAALIDQWESLGLADRRASYSAEACRALRYAFAKELNSAASALDRAAIVRVLDVLAKKGRAAMASRTAAYGRACYSWAVKRGTLDINPFQSLPVASVASRDRVLTDDELRAIWDATDGRGAFNGIVRVLLMTGQRREEVAGMAHSEISADGSTWVIPASRAKNGVAHLVPLSKRAQAVIESTPRTRRVKTPGGTEEVENAFVFQSVSGPFNGFSKAKLALDKVSGVEDWRLHDLRRTMATGLQRLGVRLEVTEAVLNHVSGSRAGVAGVYQRHDWLEEKRAALDAWGEHVAAIIEKRQTVSNIVALGARR